MYFSLITPALGLEREAAIQWSKGPYEHHQWLWQFLPAEPSTARDFLFRKRDVSDKSPGFYLLSHREPKSISSVWQLHSKKFNPQFSVHQRLAFDLRANPVITCKQGKKSFRYDVVMHRKKQLLAEKGLKKWADWNDADSNKPLHYQIVQESCVDWLLTRSERCGFRLLSDDEGNKKIRALISTNHLPFLDL